jgi:hypothetical protein
MKKWAFVLLLAGLLASAPARAVICTIDDVPAATLLLPYFEVNLDDMWGVDTVFSVNNASATAVLAHVVVWSDLSVPVLDFNIYLTGYDVQTVNLRDVLHGTLPRTASDGQDLTDTISPQGAFSQDINFASCTGLLPAPQLPASFVEHLQLSLTGKASPVLGGRCAGLSYGDNIARGYITIDTVNNCTLRFPGDPGYFAAGGTGDATNQNVLWGDYFYVTDGQNLASGNTLVHIEAAPGTGTSAFNTYGANTETSTPGQYTFYGRYVGWTAADNREPLTTNFAVRYLNGGVFDGGTSLQVWRDSKVNQAPFACPVVAGARPAWYPLGQESIVIFDEEEQPQVPQSFPVSPQPPQEGLVPFPAEAQRTQVGGVTLPVPFNFGWLYLNLNTTVPAAGSNPPEDPTSAQAWVTAEMDAQGRFSVGFPAIQLDSACTALHFVPSLVSTLPPD